MGKRLEVILEGKNPNDKEWGTLKDFSADAAILGIEKTKKLAEQEAYQWYATYPQMETRVTVRET